MATGSTANTNSTPERTPWETSRNKAWKPKIRMPHSREGLAPYNATASNKHMASRQIKKQQRRGANGNTLRNTDANCIRHLSV